LAAAADADEAAEDAELAADLAGVAPEVDEPLGELPEALDVALEEEDVEVGVGDGVAAGTVDTPLTITAGVILADPLAVAAEMVADVLLLSVLLTEEVVWDPAELVDVEVEGDEDVEGVDEEVIVLVDPPEPPPLPPELPLSVLLTEEVVWDPDELVDVEVEADEDVEVVDEVVIVPVDPPEPPPLPPELPLSNVNKHCFTSCTSSCPSGVMGVKVIVQVSVAGPIGVFKCVTIITVVGREMFPFESCRRTETAS
jgi:hypothetical protein